MSDITVINDSQQSDLVTNGLAKNGELYLKAAGSTNAGAIVVYDSGSWRTFANEAVSFVNGYSLSLDGTNDYADAGNVTQINSATNLSVSLWFNLDGLTSGGARPVLMAGGPGTFYIWPDTNTTLSYVTGGVPHSFTVSTWSTGQWYHLTTVHAGTSLEVYLDGSSIGTATVSAVASNQGNNLNIGRWNNGSGSVGNYLDGKMDEVALFTSALSSSDVTAIYNSGVPADLTSYSPVGWWRMGDDDSGSGTTVTDQGSGGNNASLVNGASFSTNVPS